jgi:hypothetical protein
VGAHVRALAVIIGLLLDDEISSLVFAIVFNSDRVIATQIAFVIQVTEGLVFGEPYHPIGQNNAINETNEW